MNAHSKIKEFRKKQGLTQQELADKLNVTKSTICRYENNERDIKITTLKQIAKALNIPVTKLVPIDNKVANELTFNYIKDNNYTSSNSLATSFMNDEELIHYFKAIVTELQIFDFLRLSDTQILKIIRSKELKTMLEVLYKQIE